MPVKALVLNCNQGIHYMGRYLFHPYRLPVRQVVFPDQRTVGGVDFGRPVVLNFAKFLIGGQASPEAGVHRTDKQDA